MKISTEFELGQSVYLKTDPDQRVRIVTAILIVPGGLLYQLTQNAFNSNHYAFEMSETKDYSLTG